MKNYLFLILVFWGGSCAVQTTDKKWTGAAKVENISDSFPWFSEGFTKYKPDSTYINELKRELPQYTVLVFAGVWCEDTQLLLPQFYKATDLAGLSRDRVELYLLDKKKKSPYRLERKYKITAVPVFIIMKDGEEVGRIVESVEESIEKDLVNLIQ